MKRKDNFTILIILILATIMSFHNVLGTENGGENGEIKWTTLIYFAGDNDLDALTDDLLLDLEGIDTSGEEIKILVMIDKLSTEGAWIYEIVNNECSLVMSYDEKNTANPLELEEFISFGMENYPSEKLMLSIKDHGYAWRGICIDETSDNQVMGTEGFANILEGKEIDLLLLDGESMASFEVAYELRNMVSYLVASESSIPPMGIPYNAILDFLAQNPDVEPFEYAEEIVDIYYDEYSSQETFAISAFNISNIDIVGDAFIDVTKILKDKMDVEKNVIAPARDNSLLGPDGVISSTSYMVDIYKFFDIIQSIPEPDLVTAIQKFEQRYNNSLLVEAHSHQFRDIPHGLNLWFPPTLKRYQSDGATLNGQFIYHDCELDLVTKSFWVQCLMDYYGIRPDTIDLTSNAGSPDDDGKFTLNWTDSSEAYKYSLYSYNTTINQLNESLILIESALTDTTFAIEQLSDGVYYYLVVAYFDYGVTFSNCECIVIEISTDSNNDNNDGNVSNTLVGIVIIIGALSAGVVSTTFYIKKRKGRR